MGYVDFETITAEGRELAMYAISDRQTYENITLPALNTLSKHERRGEFDRDKAIKALTYVTKLAAKNYVREHGTWDQPWHKMFSVRDRELAAAEMLDHYRDYISEIAAD